MANVFLSYSAYEAPTVATVVALLEESGYSVWWDRRLAGGDKYHAKIEFELRQADCTVVLWSESSIVSSWVIDEAEEAKRLNKLIPVRIDNVRAPLGFRSIQTIDLKDFRGQPNAESVTNLLHAIRNFVDKAAVTATETPAPNSLTSPSASRQEIIRANRVLMARLFGRTVIDVDGNAWINLQAEMKRLDRLQLIPWPSLRETLVVLSSALTALASSATASNGKAETMVPRELHDELAEFREAVLAAE